MEVLVIDIAHKNDLNPDQLVSYASEYSERYSTVKNNDLEKVTIDSSKTKNLVKDFKSDNRKGHDWREKLVNESLEFKAKFIYNFL